MKFIFEIADTKSGRSRLPWNGQLHFIRGQCIVFTCNRWWQMIYFVFTSIT